jgi:hypothetical protein
MVFGDAGAICGAILIDLVVSTGMCLRDKEARRLAAREAKRSQEPPFISPAARAPACNQISIYPCSSGFVCG